MFADKSPLLPLLETKFTHATLFTSVAREMPFYRQLLTATTGINNSFTDTIDNIDMITLLEYIN